MPDVLPNLERPTLRFTGAHAFLQSHATASHSPYQQPNEYARTPA